PDAMGSIAYLIKQLDIPIYATQLTAWIIEDTLKSSGINKYTIKRIKDKSIISLEDNVKVHTYKTTHSITHSIGLAFETKQGYIVFSSDYLIDFSSNNEYQTDLHKIVDISKKGVLALLTESVGATRKGYTSPNHKITSQVEPLISEAPGRIIVTAYTHSVFNIKEIINVAIDNNYRILIYNRDLKDLVHKHEKLGMPIVPSNMLANVSEINNGNILIILSGNGVDLFEQLSKVANGEDNLLKANQKDTFIIASPAIPGLEMLSVKAIDDVYRLDSNVSLIKSRQMVSMHASTEDLKMLINLLKPKYYIPVKGSFTQMKANAGVAAEMGYSEENILVLDNGDVITFEDTQLLPKRGKIPTKSILIDGHRVNDAQGVVLSDRVSLSEEGAIIIGLGIDRKTKDIATTIDIQTRGFIYIKDNEYIIDEITLIVNNIINEFDFKKEDDYALAKNKIREKVLKYVYRETSKKPIILTMLVSV
ncbi:MAG: ribonuclease J, partial [Bacilli bacterium]